MLRADSYWFLKLRGFENVPNENKPETYSGKYHTYKRHSQKAWNRATWPGICLSLCISEIQGGNCGLPPWPNFWRAPLSSLFLGLPSLAHWAQFNRNPHTLVTNQVPPSHFPSAAFPKSPDSRVHLNQKHPHRHAQNNADQMSRHPEAQPSWCLKLTIAPVYAYLCSIHVGSKGHDTDRLSSLL